MRPILFVLAAFAAACATSPGEPAYDGIHVVYHPGTLEYAIEDGGPARFVGGNAHGVYEFQASHEDFRRIAEMLAPLQENGLPCSQPSQHSAPGYVIWRNGGREVRRVEMHTPCYAEGERPLARYADHAFRAMEEMGHARYVAPVIPEPTIITLQNMYWGRTTATWIIHRGGEGSYADPQRAVQFDVPTETFDRVREIFRPYEARDFHCNRVIADGPYGFVIWSSQAGQEDQRTQWDAGCVTGDASDLFARIDHAMEILAPMRDGALEPDGASR